VLALGFVATAPAHADFAIVKFKSGYCRIWDHTAVAPPDGHFLWWRWHPVVALASPLVLLAAGRRHRSAQAAPSGCLASLLALVVSRKRDLEAKPAAGHRI
jgi:hypothetical protein